MKTIYFIYALLFFIASLVFYILDETKDMCFWGILSVIKTIEAVHCDIIDKMKGK